LIATIAAHQIRALRRQRVWTALVVSMLAVSAMAGVLGWSSAHTIVRVYDQAVTLLASSGQPAPPNPFLLKPALSLLGNMVVYITLIGALLALVLGHLSLAEDKGNGVGRLVFSRHVSRTRYAMGKMLGCAAALTSLVAVCLLVSVAALLVVNHSLSAPDLGRLALFYALSWAYLMTFVLIGAVTVLATRNRSLALLAALAVWLVVTFAVPQVTSGLRPTQSLNPVLEPAGTSQNFFEITQHARPVSIVEQYKAAAGVILHTAAGESAADTAARVVPILGVLVLLLGLLIALIQRHDYSRSSANE
jgi:ABC-type transport system involved in multi-copper enzyme maturation permease subunit